MSSARVNTGFSPRNRLAMKSGAKPSSTARSRAAFRRSPARGTAGDHDAGAGSALPAAIGSQAQPTAPLHRIRARNSLPSRARAAAGPMVQMSRGLRQRASRPCALASSPKPALRRYLQRWKISFDGWETGYVDSLSSAA
jgi:hypothetical protein